MFSFIKIYNQLHKKIVYCILTNNTELAYNELEKVKDDVKSTDYILFMSKMPFLSITLITVG